MEKESNVLIRKGDHSPGARDVQKVCSLRARVSVYSKPNCRNTYILFVFSNLGNIVPSKQQRGDRDRD
jgi:hypothetical protein